MRRTLKALVVSLGDATLVGRALLVSSLSLAALLSARDAGAQVYTHVGSLAAPTSAGAQVVSWATGPVFTPQAIIFFWTRQTAAGFADHASVGYGFATAPGSERAVAYASDHNVGPPPNAKRWQSDAATPRCIIVLTSGAAGTADAEGQLSATGSRSFTLNWVNPASSNWIVHYLAIGGPHVTNATVGSFTPTAATGSQSITGVGFQPSFLMFLSMDSDTANSAVTNGKVSIGFAGSSQTALTQGALSAVSKATAGVNVITSGLQEPGQAILEKDVAFLSTTFRASVTSFDAGGGGGFTIDKTVNSAGTETLTHYLALRGGAYRVGAIDKPATTGVDTQAQNLAGFRPGGLAFFSWNTDASSGTKDSAWLSFSAADDSSPPNQRATFFQDVIDGPSGFADGDRTWVRQGTSGTGVTNGKVGFLAQAGDCPAGWPEGAAGFICSASSARLIAEADVASFTDRGFTLDWTTNQNTYSPPTGILNMPGQQDAQVIFLAIGPNPPVIHYRSIGVANNFAGAALDGIVVTNGSTNVTKTAGLGWLAQNRGRGDVLTVGANSYVIAAVNSNNQLTLASPAVANYSANVYTIARQFRGGGVSNTALVNWEDCVDGPPGTACPAVAPVASSDLVADNRREIGIAYDDASPAILLTSTLQIQGSTTDAAHDIVLTVDPGNRHNGVAGAGVIVDANDGTPDAEFDIRDPYVTVEWLEFVGACCNNIAPIQVWASLTDMAHHVVLQNLLIHDFGNKAADAIASSGIDIAGTSALPGVSVTIRNTMIWDGDEYGIEGDAQTFDSMLIENVSIHGMKSAGIHASSTTFTIRNTIVTGSPAGNDFDNTGTLLGSHNTSSDATAALYFSNPLQASAAATFVNPASDLHLLGGATAVDSGLNLSASFPFDVDGQLRPAGAAWDRGADEWGATTAVKLQSFSAIPGDTSVRLEWRTGSELDNLGFHVYRGLSEGGPWTRSTASLIPGMGSSALGQAYSFQDVGLVNGTRYFYRLEDVDATSKTTSHGPVSAVPAAEASAGDGTGGGKEKGREKTGAGSASCPAWVLSSYGSATGSDATAASLRCTRHGDPEATSLGVVTRDARSATLELRTGGFYALHTLSGAGEASGGVRVFVPGFDVPQDPQAVALPFRRALIDAVVGRRVQLGGVRALDQAAFPGLVPVALGGAEMQVSRDGTVRAGRRSLRELTPHPVSTKLAQLLPSVFQGETKSAVVALTPLHYDAGRGQIVLSKRLRVRLLFTGRETGESGRGSRGRKQRRQEPVVGELLGRLYTTDRGLHAVSFDALFPGRRRGLAASELRLERQGQAVGFHVEPAADAFGPSSVLYFHSDATPASTDFSSELAWDLVRARDGIRIPFGSAAPSGDAVTTASVGRASFESERFYQPGLLDAPDLWLWEGLASGATRAKSFTLAGVHAATSQAAELDVYLQGASESGRPGEHHVSVSLNGAPVGEAQFAGKQPYRMSLSVPVSLLREGANELQLTNVADTGVSSYVFLDRFTVSYPQTASLTSGVFEGTWGEGGTATVSGAAVALLDVTAASAPDGIGGVSWLTGYEAAGGSLRFRAEAGRRYLAVSPQGLLTPRVAAPAASSLRATTNQADYLLIAPQAFLAPAEPLLGRRADQGLQARAVSFEEIADTFGHGQPSAEAIQGFLAYAFHSWARPSPRYVLLLGDSSYDPRNFTGTAQPSPLPALWTKTSYLWTVSDPLLAAVNGEDSLPDLAIGRLPAASVEQAESLVQKLIAWEDSGQGLSGAAALVADDPDVGGDFESDVRDIAQSFLAGKDPQLLLLSELGAGARPAIQAALDAGLGSLSYVGHGGAAVWASENVWNSWDAPSLQAQSRQPLLVTMNCLNGYFVAPAFDSLTESLLKAEGRGAIAGFSPSGLSLDGPAHQYHRALMAELTSGRHERLGDALTAAQKAYAQSGLMPELISVYHLLGDPATKIR